MPFWDYKSSWISSKFNTKKFIAYQRNQTMFIFRTQKDENCTKSFRMEMTQCRSTCVSQRKTLICTYIRMFWIIDAHVRYLESLENLRFHMTDSGDELRESRVQLIGSQGPAHLRDVLQWHRILYLLLVYIWNTVKA